ncbi:Uncharacterised protein [Serratia marcescens]|uniref:2,5-dihydroxypyridine 5,6-dioxygenase n=1 Tax=Serratia marcescens TaxID=615 RepID=A0A379ZQL4_SERMA|nr:Uncharacterised protein [Serratia marcescens]
MKYFDDPGGVRHLAHRLGSAAARPVDGDGPARQERRHVHGRARVLYGNFLFSTGPNTEVGGTRKTPCHMDIALRRCDIRLDGQTVVADGEVVAPEASRVRRA